MEEHSKDAHKVARYLAEAHTLELVSFIIDIDTMPVLERYNNLEKIFGEFLKNGPKKSGIPELWDGKASERIIDILLSKI